MKEETFEWQKHSHTYRITLSPLESGFHLQVEDTKTHEIWMNEFLESFVAEISQKAGNKLMANEIYQCIVSSLRSQTNIDMMSAFELESLKIKRGGQPSTQNRKSNKKYLILTIGSANEQKVHYPLPLQFKDTVSIDELKQMVIALKQELQTAKQDQKTNSSISDILNSSNVGENYKQQNQKMKQLIKELEQQQSQKKGAVQYDKIIRDKNQLEIKVETVKREEAKEIAKLKTIYTMKEKQLTDMKNEIHLIRKEIDIGEEGNTKLKSHIMRVVKMNETELNNSKKIIMKQQKEIQNQNRNLLTLKQNQKKLLMKIKQIQTEIDQAKKKLNTKEISNRLYSPSGSKKSTSSAPNKPVPNRVVVGNLVKRTTSNQSADNSSNASSTKPRSYNGPIKSNLVRPSYKPPDRRISDPLTRTTPALKVLSSKKESINLGVTKFSPNRTGKPPIPSYVPPPRNLSPSDRAASLNRLTQPRNPVTKVIPTNSRVPAPNSSTKPPFVRKPVVSQPKVQPKRELTQKQKNIFSKIDQIKNNLAKSKK